MTSGHPPPAAATSPTGSIYDLGYQRYDGPRLGRRGAVTALFAHSLRASFGIGRGGRAKVVPLGLAGLALLPALIAVGLQALLGRAGLAGQGGVSSPIRYDTYYGYVETLVMLFVAAQAPELLGRDQRYHVLSLYFSRALRRADYALAKGAALVTAILIVVLAPQALLFVGLSLSDRDVPAAIARNAAFLPPVIAQALAISLLLGSVSLALAAWTPRRAWATALIIGAFIVPPVIAQVVLRVVPGDLGRVIVLLSPNDVLAGLNALFFDRAPGPGTVAQADLPGPLYLAAATVAIALLLAVLVRRYQRIAA
jgi:ABC-2 type transport system permease protein